MAPQSSPAKGLQQNRPRPTVPRPIIPAIPLPYVQKRKQQEAARAKAREEAMAAAVVDAPTSPTNEVVDPTPQVTSEPDLKEPETVETPVEQAVATTPDTAGIPAAPAVEEIEVVEQNAAIEPEVETHEEVEAHPQETPKTAPSETQSNASRSTYHMPPAFVPASQTQFDGGGDPAKYPLQHTFNGQQNPMHHAHPSTGSIMFAGYPDSNASSPVPPGSGGFMPPPSFPVQQLAQGPSRHAPHQSNGGHSQPLSNGYSPMGPPPPPGYYQGQNGFMNHGLPADSYARRQLISFGPPEGYSPSGTPLPFDGGARHNNFDQHTQSFHGSQSSATNEQENGPAFYSQYPTAVISNGSNGHVDEVRLYQQPRPKPRTGSQPVAAPNGFANMPPLPMGDHLDGLIPYLQAQFADPSFADYTLELRYSDDRAPPVRVPGHNLMFARSPTLKLLMTAQARDSNSDGLTVRTLLVESDDRFLRSDGFWMAVQRLYGCPLLEYGHITTLNNHQASFPGPMPGAPQDRFDLALGYAAAGSLLQIPPVIARGVEVAAHVINWVTVEKALDFAIDGGLDAQWTGNTQVDQSHSTSTYGPAVNILIHNALNFIITAFPAGFEPDTSAPEPVRNRRLPFIQEARGTGQNPRLSLIKFGDHPSEESTRSNSASSIAFTLSKILLNLPFPLLKYVLESSRLGNVQGWANTNLRTKVMHKVIEEREKRRLKVLSSHVPNADRKANFKEWESVGWMEMVVPLDGNDSTPTIVKEWVNFTQPEN
ncbi:uncharacterized protein LY89DRAFT_779441 [Mollisia scopiformis]|uniref:Uncharacterized protein n=1 Tax=Mollisia scopiformis TaxID=149040 RepID=A0A194XKN7_MOLSC|nr:uncharacterized protein LY89DRAFT_779441 [Mollisia scopiformis]KUJ20723.1 hypothetical protein LY89DRAFT_779441 [Mollisia scopiformis]